MQVPIREGFSCMWLAATTARWPWPWSTLWGELGGVTKMNPLVALKLELTILLLEQLHSNLVLSYLSFLLLPFLHLISTTLSLFFPWSLLDLVRPFLDLVRPHTLSLLFIFAFGEDPISLSTDVEFDLLLSPLPPNSYFPSLSIPPELFQFNLAYHHATI